MNAIDIRAALRARIARIGTRERLLLLALTLGLPFLLYLGASTARLASIERDHAGQQMLAMAQLTAARLDDHVGSMSQLLTTLSQAVGSSASDTARNEALLQSLKPGLPACVNNINVWMPSGQNIGSLNPARRPTQGSVTESTFFQKALRSNRLTMEAPLTSRLNGEKIALFGAPLINDGKVVGVVTTATRLNQLQSLLDPKHSLPPGAVITVSDASGVVLARTIDPDKWIGRNIINLVGVREGLRLGEGVRSGPSAEGIDWVGGFATTTNFHWLVHVAVPAEIALAPIMTTLYQNLGVGVAMLLLGLALATWISEQIARPMRQLSVDAAILGKGELAHRSSVSASGEAGLLATTLNGMAAALQERSDAFQRSEERLSLALEGSDLALFDWNIPADRLYHSAQASLMEGKGAVEATTSSAQMRAAVHPDDLGAVLSSIKAAVTGAAPMYDAEFRIRHAAGGWVWLRGLGRVVDRDANGHAVRLAGTYANITRQKGTEERLQSLAECDSLTGLPNRALFLDRLKQAIARSAQNHKPMALLFLDLDGFKFVNDSFGHSVGDALLVTVAARLAELVRTGDTVARLGGDEFVVMVLDLKRADDAAKVAQHILRALSLPLDVEGRKLHVSASIGVSVYPGDGVDGDTLLKHADVAMYRAKQQGRNGYQCYTDDMGLQALQHTELHAALRQALPEQQFELHYQPQVDLRTGRVSAMEALIRWRHPELGLVSPARFIPLAEETGLIVPIGEWVLRTACAQLKAWHAAGHAGLSVAVNVSARQFQRHDVARVVRHVLGDCGLDARFLELELTESALMLDAEGVLQTLRELKAMGVTLALDDFGTGYSSLSYLRRFPIDVIKIDQSFTADIDISADAASITRAIIAMATSLGMKTVAEGVETEQQLHFMAVHQCDSVQGYYFSRPLPVAEMSALLSQDRRLPTASQVARVAHSVLPGPAAHSVRSVEVS